MQASGGPNNERALEQRAQHAEALFDGIQDIVFVHDLEGRILDVNPAACRRLGYSRDELLRLTTKDIDDPQFARGFEQRLQQQLAKGRLSCEGSHVAKDGRRIPVDINTAYIEIDGRPAVLAVVRDITERKRVEEALRDSEALYHSLVEGLPQNIFRKDRDGRVTFGNQRYCATLGMPLEQLLGKTDYDLFPKELAEKYRRDDAWVLNTGLVFETVEEHLLPSGAKIYVQVVKTPVRDAQGDIIGTQGIFWDVTARKRAEEALEESERRYRQLTEAALDGIVVSDQEGHITFVNRAAEQIFGYPSGEIVGEPLTKLMPAGLHERYRRGFQAYLDTRQPRVVGHTVELRGRRKDGTEFPLELSLSALDLGNELQFLGAIRDLTERQRMHAMLVQSEKLASIGLLSAGMAHEINNPLAYVANNLVVLERDLKGLHDLTALYEEAEPRLARADPEAASRIRELTQRIDLPYIRDNLMGLVQRTRAGVERMAKIVQGLRGLARTDRPELEEVRLPELVESSLEMLRGRLQRSDIQVDLDLGSVPRFRCVETQIGQVLLNLLINAVQAIEMGERSRQGRIQVSLRPDGSELRLEVVDNGCGIDPQELPRIFDPFYTSKPVGEGTGLGLSISHGIVTGHGGRIEVESEPGVGSRFRVILPLDPTAKAPT